MCTPQVRTLRDASAALCKHMRACMYTGTCMYARACMHKCTCMHIHTRRGAAGLCVQHRSSQCAFLVVHPPNTVTALCSKVVAPFCGGDGKFVSHKQADQHCDRCTGQRACRPHILACGHDCTCMHTCTHKCMYDLACECMYTLCIGTCMCTAMHTSP